MSNAKLPEAIRDFRDGLEVVAEASKNSRKLFFGMLLGCAYALLTIATTTDVRLLTNSASSPLPIIGAQIPIVLFYIVAPFILLGLYFYFHLYMQRLWEGLARLPAIFPDGRSLDEKAYPWLLTGLVRAHFFKLKWDRPPLSRLQEWISIVLAWMFVPVTLICFWLRYLTRQHWVGTTLHIVLFTLAVWAGNMFYRLAVGTLRGDESELSLWRKPPKRTKTFKLGAAAVSLGLIVVFLSLGTINGAPPSPLPFHPGFPSSRVPTLNDARTWVPHIFELLGYSPFADFREKDVSQKPPNWTGLNYEQIYQAKGAPLDGQNLRYAQGQRAFLVNANLHSADLRGADLSQADLRNASLMAARLQHARLLAASLDDADLRRVNLQQANLGLATLQGANLEKANLKGADLSLARLQRAILDKADFQGANLASANLQNAVITIEALSKVKTLYGATLDRALMDQIKKKHSYLLEKPKVDE
ncbi:MAG: hypothetical protein GTO24_06480 [candidate division Zixibacteria bacterium]|nr:hypothetical protein [candidate division Zixibacteria bacterium]